MHRPHDHECESHYVINHTVLSLHCKQSLIMHIVMLPQEQLYGPLSRAKHSETDTAQAACRAGYPSM